MQIKTVFKHDAAAFDKAVNEALADGWQLVKRLSDRPEGWIAEMVKLDPPEEPEAIDPFEALQAIKDHCMRVSVNDCGTTNCPLHDWCEQLRHGGDPTDWQLPGEECQA